MEALLRPSLVGNLYPNSGNRPKRVENTRLVCPATLKTHPEIVHFLIRVCLHIERKLKNVKGKKEKQLKDIWGYLSPRIEYLKDIPKNIFDKGISAISYTEEFKEEFDKIPKDTLKHIIDKLNSELNSILHEYDFN